MYLFFQPAPSRHRYQLPWAEPQQSLLQVTRIGSQEGSLPDCWTWRSETITLVTATLSVVCPEFISNEMQSVIYILHSVVLWKRVLKNGENETRVIMFYVMSQFIFWNFFYGIYKFDSILANAEAVLGECKSDIQYA